MRHWHVDRRGTVVRPCHSASSFGDSVCKSFPPLQWVQASSMRRAGDDNRVSTQLFVHLYRVTLQTGSWRDSN